VARGPWLTVSCNTHEIRNCEFTLTAQRKEPEPTGISDGFEALG
jgi:hypothetical protein